MTPCTALSLVAVAIAVGGLISARKCKRYSTSAAIWEHRFRGAVREGGDVERTLARALHYPKYGDPRADGTVDPDPPGDPNDYVMGEHTPASLALEAARRIRDLEKRATDAT